MNDLANTFLKSKISNRTIEDWCAKNHPEFNNLGKDHKAAVKFGKIVIRGFEQSARLWRIGLHRAYKPVLTWSELMLAADFSDAAAELCRQFTEDHLIEGEFSSGYPRSGDRDVIVGMYLSEGVCPSLAYDLEPCPFFQAWALGRHKSPYCVPSALIRYKVVVKTFMKTMDDKDILLSLYQDLMKIDGIIGQVVTDARARMVSLRVLNGWTREEANEAVAEFADYDVICYMETDLRFVG